MSEGDLWQSPRSRRVFVAHRNMGHSSPRRLSSGASHNVRRVSVHGAPAGGPGGSNSCLFFSSRGTALTPHNDHAPSSEARSRFAIA